LSKTKNRLTVEENPPSVKAKTFCIQALNYAQILHFLRACGDLGGDIHDKKSSYRARNA
jgi:hypothetical protein